MQLSVRAFRPWAFLGVLALAFFASPLSAQETGKVQGRVTDAASGQPIVGAQVNIVGSRLGNITNADGFYFINNVPAGLQDIQAQYIGYQTVTVRQQRVLSGQTLTQNFQLTQSAVEIAALEVVGETRPLVPRDQVASKNIVTGEAVEDLPVDNTRTILQLQPGVVMTEGRKDGISIRGGRSGEEAVFVDGVLVRNFNRGGSNLTIGTNSLAEVDVLTGGFSAEFGEAQSGIVNYVTRAGGQRWNGTLSLQTDEIFPKKFSNGFNRAELSLGGPLFANFGFFAAATATGEKSNPNTGALWRDVPIYLASGVDTTVTITEDGVDRDVVIPNFVRFENEGWLPFSNRDEYTGDAKLDFSYGSGSRIFLTGKISRNQARTNFGGGLGDLYNPEGFSGTRGKSRSLILGWTHNFVRSAESALSIDLKVARQHDHALSGILDDEFSNDNLDPAFGFTVPDFKFLINDENFPINEDYVDRYLRNDVSAGPLTPFDPNATDVEGRREFRMNPYGINTLFNTGGRSGVFGYAEEKQWQFRGTVDWQINRQNRARFGGDFFDIDLAAASIRFQELIFSQVAVENPQRLSLFAQDRLDLGDVVIEAGLRYDRFDPKSNFPVIPGYLDPDSAHTFQKAEVRSSLSPRLGVSFPVTVNSTFRLSYGHFTQVPDLNEYYQGKNSDLFRFGRTNTNDIFNYGGLDLAKTIAFEFGFRQLLSPDFVLDISAYNRDKLADVTVRKLAWNDPTNPGSTQYLNTLVNSDFGNVRGIDVRLDRRFGQIFDAMLGYSYQDARNTGTDPFTYTNVFARIETNANVLLGLPPNPAQAIRLTEENRKHNITGNFSLHFPANYENKLLANFGLFGTVRMLSGLPYSLVINTGQEFVTGPPTGLSSGELKDDELSTSRLPWQRHFDLKASKGLSIMGWNAQLFLDARNVLDLENRNSVVLTTGDITDEALIQQRIISHRETLGGGQSQENINLTSLDAAGGGVTNDVNLVLLRRVEARFGNGDLQFSAEEQERAFRAATLLQLGPQNFIGPGRRLRVGLELSF